MPHVFGAVAVFGMSLAQRTLSNRVRTLRRRANSIHGTLVYIDASTEEIDKASLVGPDERALALLSMTMAFVSVGALLARA